MKRIPAWVWIAVVVVFLGALIVVAALVIASMVNPRFAFFVN